MIDTEKQPPESNSELSSWLDKIQQDSWQLELIISGFVIFLLIGGWGPFMDLEYQLDLLMDVSPEYFILAIFYYTMGMAYRALLFCLLVHVLLRGLWIAAIGLRYVSGDIDYDALRYQEIFRRRLKKSIGSFDHYIERLERFCSIIFSIAFLIIFCFLSMATFVFFASMVQIGWRLLNGESWMGQGTSVMDDAFGLVVLIMGLVYFIDFVSLGFFKRQRITAKPYYYFYRVMGWVTLARFYRPLYHNLIDQKFGRRLARLLPVFIVGSMFVVSLRLVKYEYFPVYASNGSIWIDRFNYDDSEVDLSDQLGRISIHSKYPKNNYVEAFAPYRPQRHNEMIRHKFPGMQVSQYTGIKFRGGVSIGDMYNYSANYDSLLMAVSSLFRLQVDDSLRTDIAPRFYFHEKRRQPGLLYMVPTHDLSVGEHTIRIDFQRFRTDTLMWRDGVSIYFYK